MTKEQMQSIAREYAELNQPRGVMDAILKEKAIGLNTVLFTEFLQWLDNRYAIKGEFAPYSATDPNLDRISINDAGLSNRTLNVLSMAGVRTMGEVASYSRTSIFRLRGCGRRTLLELDEWFKEHNTLWT